jgi:hypothetical protein
VEFCARFGRQNPGKQIDFSFVESWSHGTRMIPRFCLVLSLIGLACACDPDVRLAPKLAPRVANEKASEGKVAVPVTSELVENVAAIQFSVGRGLYEEAISLTLSCATPGAVIRYTTDGSEPKPGSSDAYSKPILIGETTVLRAAAFKPGMGPSRIATHTYVFPKDVIASRNLNSAIIKRPGYKSKVMDALLAVPSVSLVTSETIPEDGPGRGGRPTLKSKPVLASIEWLAQDSGPGFQEYCGAEYYGGDFTRFRKKNFRLHFGREFGAPKLKFPIFAGHEHGLAAVDEFDQLELRGGSHDMVERGFYVSNIFADDSMLEMGHLNPHGRFVHLYLNGVYWGVFHLRERWGAGMHRRYLGGASSDYESINGNLNIGGWAYPGSPYDGDGSTWAKVHSLRRNYREIKQWVDLPNYVDFMLLWIYGRCEDEYRCVGPTIAGSGFKFYLNDADGFFQSPSHGWYGEPANRTKRAATGRGPADDPARIFSALLGDPDYRVLLADHIYRACFNDGALAFASVSNRLKTRCDELEKTFAAEAARWSYRTVEDWRSVRDDVLNQWLPDRTRNVFAQLRAAGLYPSLDAPALNQQGGEVANGFEIVFQKPRSGAIFFTLDGSDPRLAGGEVAPTALRYAPGERSSPPANSHVPASLTWPRITRNTIVKSRVREGKQWSALNEAFFQVPPAALKAGQLAVSLFHETENGGDGYVEVENVSAQAVNLRGARFTEGIDFTFADCRDTILAPGQKLLLVKDLFRFRQRRGLEPPVAGVYKKKKGDVSVTLSLKSGEIIASCPMER